MDPDQTLNLARTVAYRLASTAARSENQDALDLANLFLDLDSWLIDGGFLPASWMPAHIIPEVV